MPITAFVEKGLRDKKPARTTTGKNAIEINSEGWKLELEGYGQFEFGSLVISFDSNQIRSEVTVTSKRIAELIVTGLAGADLIVYGDELEKRNIDADTGEVL